MRNFLTTILCLLNVLVFGNKPVWLPGSWTTEKGQESGWIDARLVNSSATFLVVKQLNYTEGKQNSKQQIQEIVDTFEVKDIKSFELTYSGYKRSFQRFKVEIDTTSANPASYGFDSIPQWQEQTLWLEQHVIGAICLYSHITSDRNKHFFIQEQHGVPKELVHRYYKKDMGVGKARKTIQDSTYKQQIRDILIEQKLPLATYSRKLKILRYYTKPLQGIVEEINSDLGSDFDVIELPKTSTKVGVLLGMHNSEMAFASVNGNLPLDGLDWETKQSVLGALALEFNWPDNFRHMSLYSELGYKYFVMSHTQELDTPGVIITNSLVYRVNELSALVALKYRFAPYTASVRPYALVGLKGGLAINITELERERRFFQGGGVGIGTSWNSIGGGSDWLVQGFVLGIGAENNRASLNLRGTYSRVDFERAVEGDEYLLNIGDVQLIFGIHF